MSSSAWKNRQEGGWPWLIRLIRDIALGGGRKLGMLVLWGVTLYFFLRRRIERKASREFLSAAMGQRIGYLQILRHIYRFALTIFDRIFFLSRKDSTIEIRHTGARRLDQLMAQRRSGAIVVGAHFGSYDALRAFSRRRDHLKVKVLLNRAHNAKVTGALESMEGAEDVNAMVIDAGAGQMQAVLQINQALSDGYLVGILGDRAGPGERAVIADFFGRPAVFSATPWLIASVTKAPVQLGFGILEGNRRYHVLFEPFADRVEIPRLDRDAALLQYVQRYAHRLEALARQYPYNWFNFYDFWHLDPVHRAQLERQQPSRPGRRAGDRRAANA